MTRGWVPGNDEKGVSLRAEGVAIPVVGHSLRLLRRVPSLTFGTSLAMTRGCVPRNDNGWVPGND